MGNAVTKIINAVAQSYNGSSKIKTGKTYARNDYGDVTDNAAALVTQLNTALSGRYLA